MGRHGFALTLDAVIGIIIASSLLTAFFSFYDIPTQEATLHQRTASDALFILDEENIVNCTGVDENEINNTINETIPPEFSYSYNISCFEVDGSSTSFVRRMSWDGIDNRSDVSIAVRPIPVYIQHGQTGIPRLDNISRAEIGVAPE